MDEVNKPNGRTGSVLKRRFFQKHLAILDVYLANSALKRDCAKAGSP